MISAYTVAGVLRAESVALQRHGPTVLMYRAAFAVAQAALAGLSGHLIPGSRALLLVGGGNNGGDALVAGTILRRRGVAVTAFLANPKQVHEAALAQFLKAGGRVVVGMENTSVATLFGRADVIIDGLVGIGATPPLRPAAAALVELANATSAYKVAVDIPSGVHPDTGAAPGVSFAADVTVTFGGVKTGLLAQPGELVLAAVGMDVSAEAVDACSLTEIPGLLGDPGTRADKYSDGVVCVVAGSTTYPGAAILCVGAAVRLRPGMVRYAGPQAAEVVRHWPEAVATGTVSGAGRSQAWVVGPGMGTDQDALDRLTVVIDKPEPVLVDADGLTLVSRHPHLLVSRQLRGRTTVLTPHEGEFARLFPDLDLSDRLTATRTAALRSHAVVVLKGSATIISDGAHTFVNRTGCGWLASAGTGDVLSGVIGSLLATGAPPLTAAAAGVFLHGLAGERLHAAGLAGASQLWDHLR
ncbi:NAD(P)H-hydrate dehydratase [Nakamurella antarctica]|uniref:Bifunctional NAD(P)H-hydrate repair enzyme n=1 Tax=Nakamurella antarctica TaxID=1902245 RepID=A0A3G8ZPC3_9ACTN|nr:NAD(P)H-hydrate dehydratase [Nakamurella antarctica]AZI58657.1 NAD(P)H-hydrate dehydratase [Nakamurella antarctica]